MALVGYSDSEGSEDEAPVKQAERSKPTASTKTIFQKFTDSTNPHKIKVSLPSTISSKVEAPEDGEPAPKRAKTSGGGFNAMLPAPKRPKVGLSSSSRGKGLGSGVNLKTGAAPGFSREVPEPEEDYTENIVGGQPEALDDVPRNGHLPSGQDSETPAPEPPKTIGNAMKFKPLSVSRKPKKKSAAALMPAMSSTADTPKQPPPKPKVSLFSVPITDDLSSDTQTGTYKPMIYNPASESTNDMDDTEEAPEPLYTSGNTSQTHQTNGQPQSLSAIADNLNLSASQRRQLLGRKGATFADANVVEFNTETEYAANEEIRARGDTTTTTAVRALTGGKHSLQSLVSMVSNQKEALEESFAAGRRNKKEAGAKYGW